MKSARGRTEPKILLSEEAMYSSPPCPASQRIVDPQKREATAARATMPGARKELLSVTEVCSSVRVRFCSSHTASSEPCKVHVQKSNDVAAAQTRKKPPSMAIVPLGSHHETVVTASAKSGASSVTTLKLERYHSPSPSEYSTSS